MTGAPSDGTKKPKIGMSQKILQSLKILPSPEPLPEVTAPRYSAEWMEQIETRDQVAALNEVLAEQLAIAKHFAEEQERKWRERVYCELMDIADEKGRQEIIDKLLKDAHR
jgi:hypothetical protein